MEPEPADPEPSEPEQQCLPLLPSPSSGDKTGTYSGWNDYFQLLLIISIFKKKYSVSMMYTASYTIREVFMLK